MNMYCLAVNFRITLEFKNKKLNIALDQQSDKIIKI